MRSAINDSKAALAAETDRLESIEQQNARIETELRELTVAALLGLGLTAALVLMSNRRARRRQPDQRADSDTR